MTAQVGQDEPVPVGQQRHDGSPAVPVLGPAVQQHERLPRADLGDVHVELPDADDPVAHALYDRHDRAHGRSPRPTGPAGSVASTSYADAAHSHSSGRVSAGSTTSSTR